MFKPITLITSLMMLFSACSTTSYYNLPARYTDIPTPSHNYNVELLLQSELANCPPYIKVGIVEVYASGVPTQADAMEALKNRAQEMGADAVVPLNNQEYQRERFSLAAALVDGLLNNPPTDHTYIETNSVISGLGIKYIDNINYLDNYVQQVDVLHYNEDSAKWNVVGKIYKTIGGRVSKTEGDITPYERLIEPYTVDYMLYEKSPEWKYTMINGKTTRRIHKRPNMPDLSYKFKYNDASMVQSVHIIQEEPYKYEQVELNYDKNAYIGSRITLATGHVITQTPILDPKGKKVGIVVNQIVDGVEKPYLKANYHFFTNTDLQQLLAK